MRSFNLIKIFFVLIIIFVSSCSNEQKQKYENTRNIKCTNSEYKIVSQNKLKGVVGDNDSIIIPIKFDDIFDMKPCMFMTYSKENDKYGLYNFDGSVFLKTEYNGIYSPFIDTKDDNLILVEKGNNNTLYHYSENLLKEFITINNKKQKLNFLEHKYFNAVKENEILFCLYNIHEDNYEKFYLFNDKKEWKDVSENKDYTISALKYYGK